MIIKKVKVEDLYFPFSCSQKDKAGPIITNGGALPVVEVKLELAVTGAELELLKEGLVMHERQAVQDIKLLLLSDKEWREKERNEK